MQTWMPYEDPFQTAAVLDDRRLNKQRSDIVQLLKSLEKPESEDDKPLTRMWRGNELWLIDRYAPAICFEWASRENNDATLEKILAFRPQFAEGTPDPPEWVGGPIHDAHKSYLLRLQPSVYKRHWFDLSDELPMIFPRSPEKQRVNRDKRETQRLLNKAKRSYEKALESIQEAARRLLDVGLPWPTDLENIGNLPTVTDLFGEQPLDDLGSEESPIPAEPVDPDQLLLDISDEEE